MNKENFYTLRYTLYGLYREESEIEKFLSKYRFSIDFISPLSPWKLLYNLKKYKTLQLPHLLNYIFSVRDRFCEFKGIKETEGEPLFLIRIDDFPHWNKTLNDFKKFHHIMEEFKTPYLLGVTPYLSLNRHNPFNTNFKILQPEEAETIKHPLIEIAMHGLTHQTNNIRKNMEFAGLKEKEVSTKIEKGLEILRKSGITPRAFIPPFDEIDITSYGVISKYFRIITGGPASAKYLGYKVSPSFFKDAVYVPSYRPLYSTCQRAADFIKQHNIRRPVILLIVIHWANEEKEEYYHLKELLKVIKGNIFNWNDLLKIIYHQE